LVLRSPLRRRCEGLKNGMGRRRMTGQDLEAGRPVDAGIAVGPC